MASQQPDDSGLTIKFFTKLSVRDDLPVPTSSCDNEGAVCVGGAEQGEERELLLPRSLKPEALVMCAREEGLNAEAIEEALDADDPEVELVAMLHVRGSFVVPRLLQPRRLPRWLLTDGPLPACAPAAACDPLVLLLG
jgi:hypothetical protein